MLHVKKKKKTRMLHGYLTQFDFCVNHAVNYQRTTRTATEICSMGIFTRLGFRVNPVVN